MIWPYLSYFVSTFLAVRFCITLTNFVFRPRLPQKNGHAKPLVSILIPARDEELNLPHMLKSVLSLSYENLEIIVYDDESTDGTRAILQQYDNCVPYFKWIEGKELPKGWLGKNHACHILASEAKGEYLLFLDADVTMKDPFLEQVMGYALENDSKMISVFPKQIMQSFGERAIVPLMNWILLSLLPMVFVRTSKYFSFAAVNGQFMLFEGENYRKHLWHDRVKNKRAEDIAIIRAMKRHKFKVATLLGDDTIECRVYRSFGEAVNGFSKNIRAFFGNSFMFTTFFVQITTFGCLPVVFTRNYYWLATYISASLAIRVMVTTISRQNVFHGILYSIPQQLSLWIIMVRSMYNNLFSKGTWKGRKI